MLLGLTSHGWWAGFILPGMNSFLLCEPSIQMATGYLHGVSVTAAPFGVSCHAGHGAS